LPYTITTDITVGQYAYDIELYTASTVQRLLQGTATIKGEVTR
jgi:hypothetical protein